MEQALKRIPTQDIEKNPLNPRMQFEPISMDALKKSIEKVGILVPLTVYQKQSGKYCLVDGERRYRCAVELNLQDVPAIIIPEPDAKTNLLQMFTIHHLRLQWKLIWTALKLETLMLMMNTEDDDDLATYTGMSKRKIDHCKRILYYPKKYQDILLLPGKDEKISSDFFVELYPILKKLKKEQPQIYEAFTEDQIIAALMEKFRNGQINAAREFRYLKQVLDGGKNGVIPKDKVTYFFKELVSNPRMDIKQISRELRLSPGTKEMARSLEAIADTLSQLSLSDIEDNDELKQSMTRLSKEIDRLTKTGGETKRGI